MFSVMVTTGVVLAWLLLMLFSLKKPAVGPTDITYTMVMGGVGGFIGAVSLRPIMRTVTVLFNWQDYSHLSLTQLFNYVTGEMVFYGGFIGGLLAVVVFCKAYKISLISIFDMGAPALAMAHGFGRLGCLFAGCCFGMRMEEGHMLAIVYPAASLAAPPGIPLLAVPLMEAVFLFVLAAILAVVYLFVKKPGIAAIIYLFAYPAWRFGIEFFRGDIRRGVYGALTTSQYISIGIFIFGIAYFIFILKQKSLGE
jgi:phosphatidylglycerol:prolipoprotein diacylglycerol transferase